MFQSRIQIRIRIGITWIQIGIKTMPIHNTVKTQGQAFEFFVRPDIRCFWPFRTDWA